MQQRILLYIALCALNVGTKRHGCGLKHTSMHKCVYLSLWNIAYIVHNSIALLLIVNYKRQHLLSLFVCLFVFCLFALYQSSSPDSSRTWIYMAFVLLLISFWLVLFILAIFATRQTVSPEDVCISQGESPGWHSANMIEKYVHIEHSSCRDTAL